MGMFDLFKKKKSRINLEAISFRMLVHDVFRIKQLGVVATGVVEQGTVFESSEVIVTDAQGNISVRCTLGGIEIPHKLLSSASKGDHVALRLGEVRPDQVSSGYYVVME